MGGLACAMLLLAAGGVGASAGERWAGVSSGGTEDCSALSFHLMIADGLIGGYASSDGSRSGTRRQWTVTGSVAPGREVVLTVETTDARIRVGRQSTRWTGKMDGATLTLEQVKSIGCTPPRRATLSRQ
ncbi:MAG: hypothetical protein L0027_07705 [Candidatus Rokubacteria bacterium]|nr:hypothetical protein [Candidatus Rokubacteria bacterium]